MAAKSEVTRIDVRRVESVEGNRDRSKILHPSYEVRNILGVCLEGFDQLVAPRHLKREETSSDGVTDISLSQDCKVSVELQQVDFLGAHDRVEMSLKETLGRDVFQKIHVQSNDEIVERRVVLKRLIHLHGELGCIFVHREESNVAPPKV